MAHDLEETSTAVTDGIRIVARCCYLPAQSMPSVQRYAFTYTVRIRNEGKRVVQLMSRHWIITECTGQIDEVKGPGVIGEQPVLRPGQAFEYSSFAVLTTPRGEMHGSYQMQVLEGRTFDAAIAPFLLAMPNSLN